jgi:hypothetical protein
LWRHAWGDGAHCSSAAQRSHGAHCPPLSAAAQRHTQFCWSPAPVDSFGADSRFEMACSSSAFTFCALAVLERWERASSQSVTESRNFSFGVEAISA